MKKLIKSSYYFALFAIGLLVGCKESSNNIPKENGIRKLEVQIPFDNHKINEVFDPCKWVWGDNLKSEKKKRFNFFKEQLKSICSTTAIKQPMIVDSMTICFEATNNWKQWLILYMNGTHQDIKLDCCGFNGWSVDSTLCDPNICFGYYNNDNYLDFHLQNIGGTGGPSYEFFLYNNKKMIFEKSDLLSFTETLAYDRNKHTYQSGGRGGSSNFQYERFIINKGEKIILKAIYVDGILNSKGKYVTFRKFMLGRKAFLKTYSKLLTQEELYDVDPIYRDFEQFSQNFWIK